MVFSSLFFLFFFLVLCMGMLFAFRTTRAQNIVLLTFSLIFYAWGGPLLLLLLCGMTAICYFGALLIADLRDRFYRRLALFMTLALCLLLLGFFKYATFLGATVNSLFSIGAAVPEIVLPIGISFYTFQLISYVIDVYRAETEPQKKYWVLLLYASLFHQCVAGPIVRYSDVCRELESRSLSVGELSAGITRFSVGLAKKAILANSCGALVSELWAVPGLAGASSGTVFLGGVFYMLQIYLDFSAYSDMAIGMGRMAGLHYVENFDYPYTAVTVTEFWRRWHISLSSFFRDYVYIPLGGNRKGKGRQILNLLVVWGLTGLWHGASWNYLLWGIYYFVFLVLEKFILRPAKEEPFALRLLRRAGTLTVVWFGWMLFYFEDLGALGTALGSLFFRNGFWDLYARTALLNNLFFLILAVLACTPYPAKGWRALGRRFAEGSRMSRACEIASAVAPTVLLALSAIFLVGDTYNPFLYFRF